MEYDASSDSIGFGKTEDAELSMGRARLAVKALVVSAMVIVGKR